jgi:deazaflavin-dependent oxidoreductase (nitroreductase family)
LVAASESSAFDRRVIAEFRTHDGTVGGRHAGLPLLLLTSTGARTGRPRTVALTYLADDDCYVVAAGGSGANPAWYHNILAHPDVTIEVGAQKFDAIARIAVGAERNALFDRFAVEQPQLVSYQAEADRHVPMIVLMPVTPRIGDERSSAPYCPPRMFRPRCPPTPVRGLFDALDRQTRNLT